MQGSTDSYRYGVLLTRVKQAGTRPRGRPDAFAARQAASRRKKKTAPPFFSSK
ncbi:hypothetical protein ACE6ED_22015 [Paenibacillus sp. CN-4]|uniref:hypothetical protein n=1 Tax=Paenibacillus nanchangensis TaxID=3348343 RepID=UPI0039780EEB